MLAGVPKAEVPGMWSKDIKAGEGSKCGGHELEASQAALLLFSIWYHYGVAGGGCKIVQISAVDGDLGAESRGAEEDQSMSFLYTWRDRNTTHEIQAKSRFKTYMPDLHLEGLYCKLRGNQAVSYRNFFCTVHT